MKESELLKKSWKGLANILLMKRALIKRPKTVTRKLSRIRIKPFKILGMNFKTLNIQSLIIQSNFK
jgi:hypothetical protein